MKLRNAAESRRKERMFEGVEDNSFGGDPNPKPTNIIMGIKYS